MRRFLIPVLPRGFHRIRYYCLLASSTHKDAMALARKLLGVAAPIMEPGPDEPPDHRPPCPFCGGHMTIIETFAHWCHPRALPAPAFRAGDTRHDPAWPTLHDGHADGVLADDPAHALPRIAPGTGRAGLQNERFHQSDTARNHVNRASSGTFGSAALTRQNHSKAHLPIDQRVGPAGSCAGGFRMQAPETLHRPGRSTIRR